MYSKYYNNPKNINKKEVPLIPFSLGNTSYPTVLKGEKAKTFKDFISEPQWKCIHFYCAAYKPEQKEGIKMYIYSLILLFPCIECVEHLKQTLNKYPLEKYLRSNADLFFWSYIAHDEANKHYNEHHKQNPKKISPPYEDVKAFYFKMISENCKECSV